MNRRGNIRPNVIPAKKNNPEIVIDTKTSFKRDFGVILLGAIMIVASLLWKDLLTEIEELYFPKHLGLSDRFIFVMTITVILLLVAVYIKKLFKLSDTDTSNITNAQ